MHKREWLIRIRKQRKRTQQEVSDAAGIKRTTYNGYELGRRNPTIQNAKKIARVLDFESLGYDWTIFFADDCRDKTQIPA